MQIAVRAAGYSMGQADDLRRVMAKKKRELIGLEREKFVAGCRESGHTDRLAKELFDLIEPFADYGFPAAHACAYGYVAYQTAYLKAHHPVEFMSAMLTSVKDDKDRKPFYLNACRLMGIEVLPPDVNESENDFAPAKSQETGKERAIRYGLSAVRNVGEGAVGQIIDARRAKGAFASFGDFCRKVEPSVLTKRVLESLIFAGAFDSLGYARRALIENQDKVSGPDPRRAQGRGRGAVLAVRRRLGRHRGGRVGARRRGVRQAHAAPRGEGGAGAVRHRPPAPGRAGAARRPDHARDRRPRVARRRRPRDDRRHHRRGATQVHEAQRAVRAVPAGGAGRRHAGHGVPVDLRGRARPDRGRSHRPGQRTHRPARAGAADPRERDPGAQPGPGRRRTPPRGTSRSICRRQPARPPSSRR